MGPRNSKLLKIPPGTLIVREGDLDACAYTILSGRVEIYSEKNGQRMVFARLGKGQFFGEMSLILETPRAASVKALEECTLRVINRDTFNRLLRQDPEKVLPLLKILLERLRSMNTKYLSSAGMITSSDSMESRPRSEPSAGQPQTDSPRVPGQPDSQKPSLASGPHAPASAPTPPSTDSAPHPPGPPPSPGSTHPSAEPDAQSELTHAEKIAFSGLPLLEGLTPQARKAVGEAGLLVQKFPFKIGRKTHSWATDIFSYNDLLVDDSAPYHVSKNHCSLNLSRTGTYFVVDRGSTLGTWVNEIQIGAGTPHKEHDLAPTENLLILGSQHSPLRFRITFKPAP